MRKKTVLFAAILAAALSVMPMSVYAAEAPPADSSYGTLQMEIRYTEGETPDVPQTITRFGSVYYLVSQTAPVLEETLPRVRTYSYTIVGAVTQEQLDEIAGLGDEVVFTKVEIPLERAVDRVVNEEMLTNDVDDIDRTRVFTDLAGVVKKADGSFERIAATGTLERTGVTFAVSDENEDGLPDAYTATVVYRGVETYLGEGYSVEGSFETKVNEGEANVYVIVASYQTDATTLPPIVDTVFTDGGAAPVGGGGGAAGGVGAGADAGAGVDAGAGAAVTPQIDIPAAEVPTDVAPVQTIPDAELPQGTAEETEAQSILPFVIGIACVLAVIFLIQSIRRRRNTARDSAD